MTRDEYRELIRRENLKNGKWEYYADHVNFPELIKWVALKLFLEKDISSEIYQETYRRYKQIFKTGETDQ